MKFGRMAKIISAFGAASILVAGCGSSGRAWLQQKLMYFPSRSLAYDPSDVGLEWEEVHFRAKDETALHAWFIPNTNSQRVVLICHGNGGNISHRLDLCQLVSDAGLNAFIFDYRGYGKSEGKPDEAGTYADALAAFDWLIQKGFAPGQIIALGESLGGAIAAEVASCREAGGLILQSTFTSMTAIGCEVYPFLPVRWLCTFKYDTLSKLPRINAPILILHGPKDGLIPFRHGQELFAAANEPKLFHELSGGHNSVFEETAPYSAALTKFLEMLDRDVQRAPEAESVFETQK
jgi:fermentation-respiration switch protein FrsA (DUF1100 family)